MESTGRKENPTADRELIISRTIDAPRELVFEVWTKPEHLINWWGPNGFTHTFQEVNIRPGGKWKFIMHGPDGRNYPNEVMFHKVDFPSKLEYSHSDPENPDGINFTTTVTFEEVENKKTKLTMRALFPSKEALEYVVREYGAKKGAEEHIAKLMTYVDSLRS